MTATRVEMLAVLVQQLNHYDEKVGYLLRSNRKHIVVTEARIAASYAHIEKSDKRGARLARMHRSF
jgi:hypothetical protein